MCAWLLEDFREIFSLDAADAVKSCTALHLCAVANHPSLCAWLLARGADPMRRDSAGRTPLEVAQHCKNLDVAQVLQDHLCDMGRTLLSRATSRALTMMASPSSEDDHVAMVASLSSSIAAALKLGLSEDDGAVVGARACEASTQGVATCRLALNKAYQRAVRLLQTLVYGFAGTPATNGNRPAAPAAPVADPVVYLSYRIALQVASALSLPLIDSAEAAKHAAIVAEAQLALEELKRQ